VQEKGHTFQIKLDEIGKNLGGWNGQLTKLTTNNNASANKQNSPTKVGEK
jgi:hypothetical protein